MLNKKIAGKVEGIVKAGFNTKDFIVGSKFVFQEREWTITEAKKDSNTEFRRAASNLGDDQVFELKLLQDEMKNNKDFSFIELSDMDVLKAKALRKK